MIIPEDFLGLGNVRINWDRPSGTVFGYQLFYRQVSPELGAEMTVSITDPEVTNTTLLDLEAGANYSVSILAYAHLPTQHSPFNFFQLNGERPVQLALKGCWQSKCHIGHTYH